MRGLEVILLVSLAAAMVPHARIPRAVDTEGNETTTTPAPAPAVTVKPYCQEQTPCAWRLYHPKTRIPIDYIVNQYCNCSPDLACLWNEDDLKITSLVFRCRPPRADDDTTDDTNNNEDYPS